MRLLFTILILLISLSLFAQNNGGKDSTSTKPSGSWFDVIDEISKDSIKNQNLFNSEVPSSNNVDGESSESPISIIIDGENEVSSSEVSSVTETYYEDSSSEDTTNQEIFKPEIGFGAGLFTYMGDVNDSYRKNPVVGRIGRNLLITRKINDYLTLNFNVLQGVLSGNERTEDRNLNFKTDILSGGVTASYNFYHVMKKQRSIMPYFSLGIESFEFNSKGDLFDANGNYYYYWSDGSIRNIAETSPNASQSVMLQRDYNYETDLRDLDADDFGQYQQVAFGVPIDFGIDVKVTNWITMRLGNSIHFTFNDLIDNVSKKGEGTRQGTAGTDKFMYTYFSFRFNLFSIHNNSPEDLLYDDALFADLNGDEDGDGVLDFADECAATPAGAVVDEKGCPADGDQDGIPDIIDKEPNTAKDIFYVDADGIGKTEEDLLNSPVSDSIAVKSNEIKKYYPNMGGGVVKQFESFYVEIPERFKRFDLDKDDYISAEELSKAIDMFFDFDTGLTINDMYMLSDFFFEQEADF